MYEIKLLVGEGFYGFIEIVSVEYKNLFCMDDKCFLFFMKLIRVLVWILRFIKRLKRVKLFFGFLIEIELSMVKIFWIKSI